MAQKVTLKNGQTRWVERIWIGRSRKRVTARTKQELDDLLAQLRERERRRKLGLPEPLEDVTFATLATKLLDRYMKREQSKRALEDRLAYARPVFDDWLVREITAEDVEDWLAGLRAKRGKRGELSPVTKRGILKALRQVLNYGVRHGYLYRNVAQDVELPEVTEDAADPFESWEEVFAVADALATRYTFGRELVVFVCATGLRIEEWQVARRSDVDLKVPCFYVRRTNQYGSEKALGKSKGSLAPVMLQELALQAYRRLPASLDRNSLLFPNALGGVFTLSNFRQNYWKGALEAAKVRYRPPKHMRHTFATLALADGVPLEWISKQLRHSDIEVTRAHYARWLPAAEARWLALLNEAAETRRTDPKETSVAANPHQRRGRR